MFPRSVEQPNRRTVCLPPQHLCTFSELVPIFTKPDLGGDDPCLMIATHKEAKHAIKDEPGHEKDTDCLRGRREA